MTNMIMILIRFSCVCVGGGGAGGGTPIFMALRTSSTFVIHKKKNS